MLFVSLVQWCCLGKSYITLEGLSCTLVLVYGRSMRSLFGPTTFSQTQLGCAHFELHGVEDSSYFYPLKAI